MRYRSLRGYVVFLASCVACQRAAAQPQIVNDAHVRAHMATRGSSAATTQRASLQRAGADQEPLAASLSRQPFGPLDGEIALGPVDPGARWVFYCQQGSAANPGKPFTSSNPLALRHDVDTMVAYLARPSSSPLRVNALLAASDDGRYLVLLSEAQEPLLYDAEADSTTLLTEEQLDLRADGLRGSHRSIAFSPDGSRMAVLTRGKPARVTVRELASGSETTVIPMGENVWRVSFDGTSKFVVLHEMLEDTNKNRRLQWPIPERVLRNTQCSATIGALDAWVPMGDTPVTTVASIEGGRATRADGLIAMFGSKPVVKTPGDPLVLIDNGRMRRIGTPDCDVHVIAQAAQFGQILTTCTDKNGHTVLELSSVHGSRTFEYEGASSFVDRTEPEANRFVALYAGVRTYLVDFALGQVTLMQDRDQLLAQGKAGLVIRRANRILLIRSTAGEPEVLLDDVHSGVRIVQGPGHVLVGHELLSAAQGKRLGTVEHQALSVSSNGCVLVALGAQVQGNPLLKGPLQWTCPGSSGAGGSTVFGAKVTAKCD